jgi:hypothetical protein
MNKDLKQKWLAALRGGQYRQAMHTLRRTDGGGVSYCCLGVLCCVSGEFRPGDPRLEQASLLSAEALHLVGGDRNINDHLSQLNDGGRSFSEIADFIERRL